MIYRALNCSAEGWELPPITVWVQVDDAMLAEATTKLRKLLSLAWDVAEADLCIHDLCSERELEANSRLPAAAGSARWFEYGNYGELPLFGFTEDMVLLDGEHRKTMDRGERECGEVGANDAYGTDRQAATRGGWRQRARGHCVLHRLSQRVHCDH